MIPQTLHEWDYNIIYSLIEKGYYENQEFDFKEMLPTKDPAGKDRLNKTCCAFANSNGGFLIIGITDQKSKTIEERMIGVKIEVDIPEHFGNFSRLTTPFVDWDFLNPPIKLKNNNVLHVIHIKENYKKPVALIDSNGNLGFWKRTNKGNELMSYQELSLLFLNYYEKMQKLNLLIAELETIKVTMQSLIIEPHLENTTYSVYKFNVTIMESVISDSYTILAPHLNLLKSLNKLRSQCQMINNKQSIFFSGVSLPPTTSRNMNSFIQDHNWFLKSQKDLIFKECEYCILFLKEIIK